MCAPHRLLVGAGGCSEMNNEARRIRVHHPSRSQLASHCDKSTSVWETHTHRSRRRTGHYVADGPSHAPTRRPPSPSPLQRSARPSRRGGAGGGGAATQRVSSRTTEVLRLSHRKGFRVSDPIGLIMHRRQPPHTASRNAAREGECGQTSRLSFTGISWLILLL